MELGLSLGSKGVADDNSNNNKKVFCMGLGLMKNISSSSSSPPPSPLPERVAPPCVQLDLLPFSPLPRPPPPLPLRFPWPPDNMSSEPGSSDGPESRTMDMNREEQSSPNSGTSSFMEFSLYTSGNGSRENNNSKRSEHGENGNLVNNYGRDVMAVGVGGTTTSSRGSDDDENGLLLSSSCNRKKLRLSKEQSAFLEESFKEHHTLNPKQKLALAKQLNLRPRQVEVWFQNRRARTKLKQTEVDCEYLKRCCETLTEENRRLQKELHELRALKTSQPFFMQRPATTLTMCPSCERVAPTSSAAPAPAPAPAPTITAASSASTSIAKTVVGSSSITLSLGKPKPMLPFSQVPTHQTAS